MLKLFFRKNRFFSIFSVLIILIFSGTFESYSQSNDWVVQINGQKYYYNQYIKEFNLYVESTTPENLWKDYKSNKRLKKAYLENFINEKLIMQKIKEESFLVKYQKIIYDQRIKITVQLYLKKEIFDKMKDPSEKEIEDYYNSHPELFGNIEVEQAIEKIKQVLKTQKYNEKVQSILQEKKEAIIIKRNPEYFEKGNKVNWVLKIGDKIIDYDSFQSLFEEYLKTLGNQAKNQQSISLLLTQFTDQYINNYLLYNDIKKTDFEKRYSKEIDYLVNRMIIEFYVSSKLKNKIQPVTPEAVEAYYQQNKEKFAKYTPQQARALITQYLNSQLYEMLVKDLVQSYRDESIIKRNKTLLKSLGLD